MPHIFLSKIGGKYIYKYFFRKQNYVKIVCFYLIEFTNQNKELEEKSFSSLKLVSTTEAYLKAT